MTRNNKDNAWNETVVELKAGAKSLRPILSVIMPVFNEAETLPVLLQKLLRVPLDLELVIVDDASTDGTRDMLRKLQTGDVDARVFYHETNMGKGAAIRTAIPHARGLYSIIQDGDLEYDPNDYVAIVEALEETGADAVYGSRFLENSPRMRLPNRIVNRLLASMVKLLYHAPLSDEATCYKAFRTDVLQSIPLACRRFEFCPEVTARLLRRGGTIVEVPIKYEARNMAQGKKIRWTDGVSAIWTLIKYRLH